MKVEYITIKKFSEIAKVSPQSIYKKLKRKDNPINQYYKEVDGKRLLSVVALKEIYHIDVDTEAAADDLKEEIEKSEKFAAADQRRKTPREKKDNTEKLIDLLEQQLREKDQQLNEKDRQLREKDQQINSLLCRLEDTMRVVDQQQKLSAIDKGLITTAAAEEEKEEKEIQKKRGLFNWFGR